MIIEQECLARGKDEPFFGTLGLGIYFCGNLRYKLEGTLEIISLSGSRKE